MMTSAEEVTKAIVMPRTKLTGSFVRRVTCPDGREKIDYFDVAQRGFLLEVRASGLKTYYQRYTDDRGRERQFRIGPADVLTLRQAKLKGLRVKADVIMGGDPSDERAALRLIPTLQAFVQEQYLPYIQTYKRSWKTDETVLRIHVLGRLGQLHLDEITTQRITELTRTLQQQNYAPGTIGRVIVILRYLFNLARKWKVYRGENPASGLPVPDDVQRNRFLNEPELARLLEALRTDPNEVAAQSILLLLLTGARRNEVTHARWAYIDFEQKTLLVPLSKSGKPRLIHLNAPAIDLLKSISRYQDNPYIFPSPITGRPSASLHFPWTRIRKRAGLKDVRLHDLRHSFASLLINNGARLYDVQRLLGHLNPKTTQRYAHLSHDRLGQTADVAGGIIANLMQPKARQNDS